MILAQHYGPWALITGATSGIGYAFAKKIVQENINCILISNDGAALVATKQELSVLNPGLSILTEELDLNNIATLKAFLSSAMCQKINIVINCAGVGMIGAVVDTEIEEYLKLININLLAPLIISHHFVRLFNKNQSTGAIINVSSANAQLCYPIPFSAVYTPTKLFIKMYTESLAYEIKYSDIDILDVACGPTKTSFQQTAHTKTLPWCETPDSVVLKAFKKLGHASSVITNPISRILIVLFKWLPLPKSAKLRIVAWYFGKLLGGAR